MRSRRGTNEALRALFDLVPPQATVLRDGQELTIPSSGAAHRRTEDWVVNRQQITEPGMNHQFLQQ
jgi:hypothetical protein